MRNLGILGSTRGTGMLALIKAIQDDKLNAKIKMVISNKKEAKILERAREHKLSAEYLEPGTLSHTAYDQRLIDTLLVNKVDMVVLIGYMRILSPEFIKEWHNRIINVHPSLLPDFAGMTDENVHKAVLKSGATETGCTVHFVTEDVDAGPILIQKKCPVLPNDTVETLKERVQKLEGEALIEAVKILIQ